MSPHNYQVPSEDPDKSVDELEQSADLMSDSTIGQEKSTKKKKRKVKRTTESEQELVRIVMPQFIFT